MADREREAELLRSLVLSPIWEEVLRPKLEERLHTKLYQALSGRGSLPDAVLRAVLGEAAECQWLLTWPGERVKEYDQEELEKEQLQQRMQEVDLRAEHLATYGAHSPFLAPGEEESSSGP